MDTAECRCALPLRSWKPSSTKKSGLHFIISLVPSHPSTHPRTYMFDLWTRMKIGDRACSHERMRKVNGAWMKLTAVIITPTLSVRLYAWKHILVQELVIPCSNASFRVWLVTVSYYELNSKERVACALAHGFQETGWTVVVCEMRAEAQNRMSVLSGMFVVPQCSNLELRQL